MTSIQKLDVRGIITNLVYKIEYHILGIEYLDPECFMVMPPPLSYHGTEDNLAWESMTRTFSVNDNIGIDARVKIFNPYFGLGGVMIITLKEKRMKCSTRTFMDEFIKKVIRCLNEKCRRKHADGFLKVTGERILSVKGEIKYTSKFNNLIAYFLHHPAKRELLSQKSKLSCADGYVLGVNVDTFEYQIRRRYAFGTDKIYLNSTGGTFEIHYNVNAMILLLHEFFHSLQSIKARLTRLNRRMTGCGQFSANGFSDMHFNSS